MTLCESCLSYKIKAIKFCLEKQKSISLDISVSNNLMKLAKLFRYLRFKHTACGRQVTDNGTNVR